MRLMLLTRLCKKFNDKSLKYAIAGGFAVALHGAVRGTVDVDILLDLEEKNLIAWSFYNPNNPSEIIDILIHKDLADMNSTKMKHAEIEISVIAKQDLIDMKRESGRPQDIEDIKALESLN